LQSIITAVEPEPEQKKNGAGTKKTVLEPDPKPEI